MVEFILVSVGAFAVIVFLWNIRGRRSVAVERPLLDGSPKWVAGTIAGIAPTAEVLGMTVADVTLSLGANSETASGPIPPSYEAQIVVGLPVRAHVEYDLLDTLQTDLWDSEPDAVLAVCAAKLGVDGTFGGDDPREFEFSSDGKTITILLAVDGWVTILIPPGIGEDIYVDIRSDFNDAERAHMLTERLGVTQDQAEEARDFLDALGPATLERLEALASLEGWICVEGDGIEFEFALPFPEGELLARLVTESLAIVRLIEADLAQPGDGAW